MFSSLAVSLLLFQGQLTKQIDVPNNNIAIRMNMDRLEPAKLSPKLFGDQRLEFDWITSGYGNLGEAGSLNLRLRVYSQERKGVGDKAPMVARMVMQLWDRCFKRLKLDHATAFNNGIIDFFLCFGGDAGGEQLLGEEIRPNIPQPIKVNTIYIYKLQTFTDPMEMAREVAHEYGHAILPPIGGFKQPEPWGSGYLGEKLFLKWIRDDMVAKRLGPEDAMGASLEKINAWLSVNVDKLVEKAAGEYPEPSLFNESRGGMDAFNGLAMYIETLCPPSVFLRSLQYTRDAHKGQSPPTDFGDKILLACSEVENLALAVPPNLLAKKTIWIPLGKGTISGATVVGRKNGWAQVAPLMPNIVIKNPKIG